MDWISVKDRLPEDTCWVLCFGDGAMTCYAFDKGTGRFCDWAISKAPGLFPDDVTHWQPLPDPPKEG